MKKPITETVSRLRQRRRTDGSWRVWWEADQLVRDLGFATVDLDPNRPTWSIREAKRLNDEVTARQSGKPAPGAGGRTVAGLVASYRRSSRYKRLAEKTRKSYDANMRLIERKWGEKAVAHFTKPVMHTWYETLLEASGEYQARALLRMFSILFSFAEIIGWRPEQSNPCTGLQMSQPKGRRRTVTWEEFDALSAAALALGLPSIDTAIRLSLFAGQRETDVLEALCGDFKDMTLPGALGSQDTRLVWLLIRSKRSNAGAIPVHDEAAPAVRRAIGEGPDDRALLIEERVGRAYDVDLFQKRYGEVRAKAAEILDEAWEAAGRPAGGAPAIDSLQFRDLRRTFGAWSRAGGATKDDTGDVLGNSAAKDPFLALVYMAPQFDTTRRAVDAISRPETAAKEKRA